MRGPDTLWGGDIRTWHAPPSHFNGIIGGPPCQDFSSANRRARPQRGMQLVSHFIRIVTEARPQWYLAENVPRCPDIRVDGFTYQRLDITGHDCGLRQRRLRHFHFGTIDGSQLYVPRARTFTHHTPAACLATTPAHARTRWHTFCQRQGLSGPLTLPAFTVSAKYKAVGNGVPLPMARMMATAIVHLAQSHPQLCKCGCGRAITGRQEAATAGCRKRYERQRSLVVHSAPSSVTMATSQRPKPHIEPSHVKNVAPRCPPRTDLESAR